MIRNGIITGLMVVTLLIAGCAHSTESGWFGKPRWKNGAGNQPTKKYKPYEPQILPETHLAAGKLLEQQGRPGEAIVQYRKAIAVNHEYVDAYHHLGVLLSRVGQRKQGVEMLREAVARKPKDALIQNNFGYLLMLERQWVEAEHAFQKAVKLRPQFARAHINLGMTQGRLGKFDQALANFKAVLPEEDAYYNLGLIHRGQQNYPQARQAFRTVLDINPNFTAAHEQLARINQGERQSAPSPEFAVRPVEADRSRGSQQGAVVTQTTPVRTQQQRTTMSSTPQPGTTRTARPDPDASSSTGYSSSQPMQPRSDSESAGMDWENALSRIAEDLPEDEESHASGDMAARDQEDSVIDRGTLTPPVHSTTRPDGSSRSGGYATSSSQRRPNMGVMQPVEPEERSNERTTMSANVVPPTRNSDIGDESWMPMDAQDQMLFEYDDDCPEEFWFETAPVMPSEPIESPADPFYTCPAPPDDWQFTEPVESSDMDDTSGMMKPVEESPGRGNELRQPERRPTSPKRFDGEIEEMRPVP